MTWKADYAALPARLTAARRRAGLTQPELAGRLGISLATIQRVEAGRTDPKLSLVVRWTALVGLRLQLTPLADDPSNLMCSPEEAAGGVAPGSG